MDPRLCEYPSKRFYDGDLKNSTRVVEEASQAPMLSMPSSFEFKEGSPGHPAIFIDTADLECNEEELVPFCGARSLQNRLEASLVAELLTSWPHLSANASVITAYGAQRDLLAEALHGTKAAAHSRLRKQRSMLMMLHGSDPFEDEPHPRTHSVDGFQGNENDTVVFSAVRSNNLGQTGFVGDPQRLCVLLTRARRCLVVVGNSDTLQHDEEWLAWLEEAPKQTFVPTRDLMKRLLQQDE